jgi:hypothetical protein
MSSNKKPTQRRGKKDRGAPEPQEAEAPKPKPPSIPADDPAFDALLAEIMENPEKVYDAKLAPETIKALMARLNPYASVIGERSKEQKHIAACSYTNLREDYLRRFVMTSLVSFLHQMVREWEVPPDQRSWIPAEHEAEASANRHPDELKPWQLVDLLPCIDNLRRMAGEAQKAQNQADAVHIELQGAELSAAEKDDPAKKQRLEALRAEAANTAANAAGLQYAMTYELCRLGIASERRLRQSADAAMQHVKVREVLAKYPERSLRPEKHKQTEIPAAVAKGIIEKFVHHWFEYDPYLHVRSAHDGKEVKQKTSETDVPGLSPAARLVDAADPERVPLEEILGTRPQLTDPEEAENAKTLIASPRAYQTAVASLRDPDLGSALAFALAGDAGRRERFRRYILPLDADSPARAALERPPPQDTFHRWSYFTEVNYEELRTATETLYGDKSDLDWALALWDEKRGSPEEVDKWFEDFCKKHQDTTPSAIKALEFNAWTLLGDFKENRSRVQFYNKNTEILKRILDRHAQDKKIGAELMRERVRQTKAREIRELGPDAPGLADYRRGMVETNPGGTPSALGAERVIPEEEMKRLEKARGDIKAAKELEFLETQEKIIAELTEVKKAQPLSREQLKTLEEAEANLVRAKEMIRVPRDAVQVDVFTVDAGKGTIEKSHFYTKAEGPQFVEDSRQDLKKAIDDTNGSTHPAMLAQTAQALGAQRALLAANAQMLANKGGGGGPPPASPPPPALAAMEAHNAKKS